MRPGRKLIRPTIKLLVVLLVSTIAVIWLGIDLLDGDAEVGAFDISAAESPVGFGIRAFIVVSAGVGVALGWLCAFGAIGGDESRYRYRAPIDDPSY